MGTYGTGSCLFLAGFSPQDGIGGASLSLLVIDVAAASVLGSLRLRPAKGLQPNIRNTMLDRVGGTVYDVGANGVYLVTLDGSGEYYVERFPLPFTCVRS